MTIDEIFSQLSDHMIEGIMTHSQLADYYCFLGLEGYAKCHEYHFLCENIGYRELCNYYMKHYNKIIAEMPTKNPNVIPSTWVKYARQDVDPQTRKTALQAGIERWVNWEYTTKILYQNIYKELMTLNEITTALEIEKYISDVDAELELATQKLLESNAIDYDINTIMEAQDDIYKKYKKKIKEIELC